MFSYSLITEYDVDIYALKKTFDSVVSISSWKNLPGIFSLESERDLSNIQLPNWIKSFTVQKTAKLNSFRTLHKNDWGLDRLDNRNNIKNKFFQFNQNGTGVDVYLLDSGIDDTHTEFQNTITTIHDSFLENSDSNYGEDTFGHGTSVASLICGSSIGVAPNVRLKNVRVFDSSQASEASILSGISAVVSDHNTKNNGIAIDDPAYIPSVVNISWNLEKSFTIDAAIEAMIGNNILCVVSAGNNNDQSFNFSPSGVGTNYVNQTLLVNSSIKPIVVSSTNIGDSFGLDDGEMLSGSLQPNWGAAVDLFAPGDDIRVAILSNQYASKSGTSLSSAYVSGLVALRLQSNKDTSINTMRQYLIDTSTKDVISFPNTLISDQTPNRLAFNGQINSNIAWITQEDVVLTQDEKTQVNFQIAAVSVDELGIPLPVQFSLKQDSNNLFDFLTFDPETGNITGEAPLVDALAISGYPGILGFKYDFQVEADNGLKTKTRDFSFIIRSVNQSPIWNDRAIENLNALDNSGDNYEVGETLSIDFNNLTDTVGLFDGITDPDGDTITFSVLNGSLPDGINLSSNGILSGTFLGFPIALDSNNLPLDTTKTFDFVVRASDPNGRVSDRNFKITVTRQNSASQNVIPAWISTFGKLTEAFQTQNIQIKVFATDPDDDKIFYSYGGAPTSVSAPSSGSSTEDGTVFHTIPDGVSVLESGDVAGIVDNTNLPGQYWFDIDIDDGIGNTISETFFITVKSKPQNNFVSEIEWITPSGSLGSINESFPSYFEVAARALGQTELLGSVVNPTIDASGQSDLYKIRLNEIEIIFPETSSLNEVVTSINNSTLLHGVIAENINGTLSLIEPSGNSILIQSVSPAFPTGNSNFDIFSVIFGIEQFAAPAAPLLEYTLAPGSGNLPPLLRLETNNGICAITGVVDYVETDKTNEFTIRASVPGSPFIFNDRTFSIDVKNIYSNPVSEIFFPLQGSFKEDWDSFHSSSTNLQGRPLIERSSVFQDGSEFYGIRNQPEIYLLGGISISSDSEIYEVLEPDDLVVDPGSTHFKNLKVTLGSIKQAVARDPVSGNIIYEVLYYEVLDSNQNAGGFNKTTGVEEDLVYPQQGSSSNTKGISEIYPPSFFNWRQDITNQLGLEGIERLPLWMSSEQTLGDSSTILGYTPSLVVVFLKPSFSERILNNIRSVSFENGLDKFNGKTITLDRYVYQTITGTGTVTSFDSGSTTFDSGKTTFDLVPVVINNKYFKFPVRN